MHQNLNNSLKRDSWCHYWDTKYPVSYKSQFSELQIVYLKCTCIFYFDTYFLHIALQKGKDHSMLVTTVKRSQYDIIQFMQKTGKKKGNIAAKKDSKTSC